MQSNDDSTRTASWRNLRRLFWLRNVVIAGQFATLVVAETLFGLDLPSAPLLGAIATLAVLNLLTWRRLARLQRVADAELLAQLVLDIGLYATVFYWSGGYTNPFVWMFLLPLSVAAVALPWRHTWLVAGLGVGAYTLLMFFYRPLPQAQHAHQHDASAFGLHLLGMWFGFLVSAGIIAYFVARIGANLREYDRLQAEAREKALESERMLALATLATAAAHELGTPLATMAVVVGELADEHAANAELAQPLALLKAQIQRCKEILTSITTTAGEPRAADGSGQGVEEFLHQLLARWQDLRPGVALETDLHGPRPAPRIAPDRTLGQALMNLLDNAADASPGRIAVDGGWENDELRLTIRDYGPGLSGEARARAGTPFFTTKPERGLGLGLYLARLVLERFGGAVTLTNHDDGGAVTAVHLPLEALRP